MPDGHEWGTRERDPARFAVVVVPGPPADYAHLVERAYEDSPAPPRPADEPDTDPAEVSAMIAAARAILADGRAPTLEERETLRLHADRLNRALAADPAATDGERSLLAFQGDRVPVERRRVRKLRLKQLSTTNRNRASRGEKVTLSRATLDALVE